MNDKTTAQPDVLQILAQFERNDGYRLDGSVPREWAQAAYNALSALSAGAAFIAKPTKEQAHEMGAKGAPATEDERLLFEEWMRGHCWALSATWDGKGYRSDAEQRGNVDPWAVQTRRIWAAWRDRAALAATQPAVAAGLEFPALTPELAKILGTMCFQCITFAQALRQAGHQINTRAEDEQAATLHWMLGHYFRHGEDGWRQAAMDDMERMRTAALPPAPSTEGEARG